MGIIPKYRIKSPGKSVFFVTIKLLYSKSKIIKKNLIPTGRISKIAPLKTLGNTSKKLQHLVPY